MTSPAQLCSGSGDGGGDGGGDIGSWLLICIAVPLLVLLATLLVVVVETVAAVGEAGGVKRVSTRGGASDGGILRLAQSFLCSFQWFLWHVRLQYTTAADTVVVVVSVAVVERVLVLAPSLQHVACCVAPSFPQAKHGG